MQVSKEFYDALDKFVEMTIENAIKRAVDNNRVTIKPRDL